MSLLIHGVVRVGDMFGQKRCDSCSIAGYSNLSSFLVRMFVPHLVAEDVFAHGVVVHGVVSVSSRGIAP